MPRLQDMWYQFWSGHVFELDGLLTGVGVVDVGLVAANDLARYHTDQLLAGDDVFLTKAYPVSVLVVGLLLVLPMLLLRTGGLGLRLDPSEVVDHRLSVFLGLGRSPRVVEGSSVSTDNLESSDIITTRS